MRLAVPLIAVSAAALALAATSAATAATLSASVGPNSSSATQACSPPQGTHSGSTTQTFATSCFDAGVGTASGAAIAATGHVGGSSQADSHNGNSLVAAIGSESIFDDFLFFSSSNPLATTADVSANLLLDGFLEATGPVADASFDAMVILNGQFSEARFLLTQDGVVDGFNHFIVDAGGVGPVDTNLAMHTPFVNVFLNSPVHFQIFLQTGAVASGPGAHALADFEANSFKLPSLGPAFRLADGVTVNAGDYLVNNHFIDPLAQAAGVPEPAAWTLMIAGFGLAGSALRRRLAVAAN